MMGEEVRDTMKQPFIITEGNDAHRVDRTG